MTDFEIGEGGVDCVDEASREWEDDGDNEENLNLELYTQRVHQYADLDELTAYVAHDLIRAIYVGAPNKSTGKRRQSICICICYDFVSFILLDELMKQETA